jgi:5-(aminomethyl)-3-furanmethanol phosphate kinase
MTPMVLKLGGSLAETGRLRALLALVSRTRRAVVVVPGGGPFADAVRTSQALLRFSDGAAHDMALLAMHQMATAMIGLEPRLVAADTLAAMKRAWRLRHIPVWLPSKLCSADRRIPRDWTITSDGLAARLAERLGDAELLVVKSCAVQGTASARTLARQGIVDPVFATIVERAGLAWRVIGPGESAALADALDVAAREPGKSPPRRRAASSTTLDNRGRAVARAAK